MFTRRQEGPDVVVENKHPHPGRDIGLWILLAFAIIIITCVLVLIFAVIVKRRMIAKELESKSDAKLENGLQLTSPPSYNGQFNQNNEHEFENKNTSTVESEPEVQILYFGSGRY